MLFYFIFYFYKATLHVFSVSPADVQTEGKPLD